MKKFIKSNLFVLLLLGIIVYLYIQLSSIREADFDCPDPEVYLDSASFYKDQYMTKIKEVDEANMYVIRLIDEIGAVKNEYNKIKYKYDKVRKDIRNTTPDEDFVWFDSIFPREYSFDK